MNKTGVFLQAGSCLQVKSLKSRLYGIQPQGFLLLQWTQDCPNLPEQSVRVIHRINMRYTTLIPTFGFKHSSFEVEVFKGQADNNLIECLCNYYYKCAVSFLGCLLKMTRGSSSSCPDTRIIQLSFCFSNRKVCFPGGISLQFSK